MTRFLIITVTVLALVALVVMGCTSTAAKAQKMFDEGKYEEVIAQFSADPNMSAIVAQAKEKLAEKWVTEGLYDSVLVKFPETNAAKVAKNKKAEQLFLAGNYQEVVTKYMDTTWGPMAKAKMDSIAAIGKPGDGGSKPGSGVPAAVEKAAQTELDRIMGIKMKDLRTKALREFVAKAEFAGTKALAKAKDELGK